MLPLIVPAYHDRCLGLRSVDLFQFTPMIGVGIYLDRRKLSVE